MASYEEDQSSQPERRVGLFNDDGRRSEMVGGQRVGAIDAQGPRDMPTCQACRAFAGGIEMECTDLDSATCRCPANLNSIPRGPPERAPDVHMHMVSNGACCSTAIRCDLPIARLLQLCTGEQQIITTAVQPLTADASA